MTNTYPSVNSSCAQPPSPPGLLRGICPPCQSRGWGIYKFCAAQGPTLSFWHARSFLSQCNYTEDFPGKTSRLAHLSRTVEWGTWTRPYWEPRSTSLLKLPLNASNPGPFFASLPLPLSLSMEFKMPQQQRQREHQKSNRLNKQKNNSARAARFFARLWRENA